MSLIVAGCRSGEGKTTVTLALLSWLAGQKAKVQSYKVGPDYLDPMFHSAITKRPCRNLDPLLTSEDYVHSCFARHSQGVEYALIEGVMGLFDGIRQDQELDFASTAHIARILDLPILLVIDCSRLSGSVAAIAHGYSTWDPRVQLAGLILNKVASDRHLQLLETALEPLSLPILGVLRRQELISLPERHLGLVTPTELPNWGEIIEKLTNLAQNCFDWSRLLPLMRVESSYSTSEMPQYSQKKRTRIALAYDQAFNFYYQDNLDLLSSLGAELIPWSPLADAPLPELTQGIYLGGGYPELFTATLATNHRAIASLRQAITQGIPTYAECGGLMYLTEHLIDLQGQSWRLLGILPTTAVMTPKLTLGYRQVITRHSSIIVAAGEEIRGHEFHRSQLTTSPLVPLFHFQENQEAGGQWRGEGWCTYNLHASYIHLHWGATPCLGRRFLAAIDNQ